MTVTIEGNDSQGFSSEKEKEQEQLHKASYEYDYPEGLNLKPGSKQHDEIRDRILRRARESYRIMQRRHKEWRSIDRVLRAYVPADADEDSGFPQIVIPQSYATLETLLTYFTAAFLQDPILKYEGSGPEDVLGGHLLTKLIHLQNKKFHNGLALHTQWRDAFAYGVGAITPVWERKLGRKTVVQETGFLSWVRKQFIVTGSERKQSDLQVLFEGNKLKNIDPYKMLPDPEVSAHAVQEGEFFGWIDHTNYMKLRKMEFEQDSFIFNTQYLKHTTPTTNIVNNSRTSGREKSDTNAQTTNPVDVVWMHIDLIPESWGLGRSQIPEKWLFALGGDEVVLAAMPQGLNHGMIPATVAAPDFDGYSANPVSRLGIIHDLQFLTDFLHSSHIQNVKKVINDMLVVDPTLVNIFDVNDPKAGKIIRTRRKQWGKGGLDNAIKQLDVKDVTQNHIVDANILGDIIQQTTGATDNLKGVLQNRSSRVSASEFQGIRTSSLSRLEKAARMVSMQSMMPLANMMASQTQQLMEEETYIKAIGEWASRLQEQFGVNIENERLRVDPMDIIVNYDVEAHDGTIPGSSDSEKWFQIFQTMAQQPILQQQFDIVRVFEHLATQIGAKNIEQFKRNINQAPAPQVERDEDVDRAVDRGDLRPATNGQQ